MVVARVDVCDQFQNQRFSIEIPCCRLQRIFNQSLRMSETFYGRFIIIYTIYWIWSQLIESGIEEIKKNIIWLRFCSYQQSISRKITHSYNCSTCSSLSCKILFYIYIFLYAYVYKYKCIYFRYNVVLMTSKYRFKVKIVSSRFKYYLHSSHNRIALC